VVGSGTALTVIKNESLVGVGNAEPVLPVQPIEFDAAILVVPEIEVSTVSVAVAR
jgi:hypothetical protein